MPAMFSCRDVVPATVKAFPDNVRVPVPVLVLVPSSVIVTCPETDMPDGRLATDTEYVPSAMYCVVTGNVTVPGILSVIVPL